jgi:hypothetical protein
MATTDPDTDPTPPRSRETAPPDLAAGHGRHWEALLDGGLIGRRTAPSPEAVAIRTHDEALFRRLARREIGLF